MVSLRTPPVAQSDIQSMRHFYSRLGHPAHYEHCHSVYSKAARAGIIEEDIVRDRKIDPDRRWANVLLRRIALAHSVDPTGVRHVDVLPPALRDKRVLEELEIFGKLTDLERRGAPRSDYEPLLNNGQKPKSLLIKLADFSVTHGTEDQLEGFISNGGSSNGSLVRQYGSLDEARLAMKMDANAGETIYAPVAELFGYPELAGDIFLYAFRVNHPEIYNHVIASMQDPGLSEKLSSTQMVGSELAKIINTILKTYGFDAEVTVRKEKHDGKKMKKTLTFLRSDYDHSDEQHSMSFDDYVARKIHDFDFERFNDWVAIRVVLKRFRGISVDELIKIEGHAVDMGSETGRIEGFDIHDTSKFLENIRVGALRLAVKLVSDTISSVTGLYEPILAGSQSNVVYYQKPNGYRGFHFDTQPRIGGSRMLPFEVQLKTDEWHDVAEHGKAAHYYYLGGDNAFVDMIARTYHDIIHPPPVVKPNGRGQPLRRPSFPPTPGSD